MNNNAKNINKNKNKNKLLHTEPLGDITRLAKPEDDLALSLQSSAVDILTDFKIHRPLLIDSSMSVVEAEQHMRRAHAKLEVVVDPRDNFLGMVSYKDLEGEKYQRLIGMRVPRTDIKVEDVMTTAAELRAVSFDQVSKATIGDVVYTLYSDHCEHFIVIDPQSQEIRGVFSAADLARRLHIPIEISHAPTFADICHQVSEHTL